MSSLRAGTVLLCVTALLTVAVTTGCSSLSSQEPAGVRLAGDWKLDPARSDDLGKALAQLRAQGRKKRGHAMSGGQAGGMAAGGEGPAGGGRRGRGVPGSQQGGQAGQDQSTGEQPGLGPAPHVSPADELMANVPQGDYLRIAASSSTFTVTTGDSSAQYTPGLESEVSEEQGDAQQISGWKGAAYVIDTTPQLGAEVIQTYGLTKDGRLKMTVRLAGGGTHFTFTRIYDRTTQAPPLGLPINN